MITSEKEYNELLYVINDPNNINEASYYRIPYNEPIYEVNLNTRKIQAPEFLSVLEDHNAEVVWFKVDRFYDDVDLYGCACWIQYKNALKEEYIAVSTPKVIAEGNHDVLYMPWPITSSVAKAAGDIEFSFQFFKLSEDKKRVFYSINTTSAKSKILHGLHIDPLGKDINNQEDENPQLTEIERLMREVLEKYQNDLKDYNLYWLQA